MPSLFRRPREPSPTAQVNELSVTKFRALFPRRKRSTMTLTEPKSLMHRSSLQDGHGDDIPTESHEVEDKPSRMETTVFDTKTSRANSPPDDMPLPPPQQQPPHKPAAIATTPVAAATPGAVAAPTTTTASPMSTAASTTTSPSTLATATPDTASPIQRVGSDSVRPTLAVDTSPPAWQRFDTNPDAFETPVASPSTPNALHTLSPLERHLSSPESLTSVPGNGADVRRILSHTLNSPTPQGAAVGNEAGSRRLSDRTTSTPQDRRRASSASLDTVSSPRRMPAVLHSPPMPQPIAYQPTFSSGPNTPSWGTLALEGGPRSPALSRQNSRQTGGAQSPAPGFPFFSSAPASAVDKTMTDAEARKAAKTMPVMLRMPSHRVEEDGGEAEDDDEEGSLEDDDDESGSLEEGAGSTAPRLSSAPPQPPSTNRAGTGMLTVMEESASRPESVDLHTPQRGYFESQGLRLAPGSPRSGTQTTPSTGVDDASFVESEGDTMSVEETTPGSPALQTPSTPSRPALYSQVSQSMVNLPTPTAGRTMPSRPRDADLSRITETPLVASPPLEPWAMPPPTPSGLGANLWEPRSPPALKRRLSAGDADPPPPKYAVNGIPGDGPKATAREEEGKEHLPPYWCGVHIEGTLARKMEFTSPGVQARDRGWKKYYFVLHGTALFVYKFDPTKVPLRQGEPYLTCDARESEQFLHVHLAPENHRAALSSNSHTNTASSSSAGPSTRRNTINLDTIQRGPIGGVIANARRGTIGSNTPPKRDSTPEARSSEKSPELFQQSTTRRRQSSGADSVASSTASAPIASHLPFAQNHLVHIYSLHGAESGLAADYKKRLHCVRVRAEGQQFMLQTDTARQCVQWIEAFQAGTNVSMDLDIRPMPVQQTLPRRRRRAGANAARRASAANGATPAAAAAAAAPDVVGTFSDTPEGNAAAVEAAERRAHDRDRMLAEDQAAESHGSFRT